MATGDYSSHPWGRVQLSWLSRQRLELDALGLQFGPYLTITPGCATNAVTLYSVRISETELC